VSALRNVLSGPQEDRNVVKARVAMWRFMRVVRREADEAGCRGQLVGDGCRRLGQDLSVAGDRLWPIRTSFSGRRGSVW
jgi:hypothetical protein